MCIYVKGTALSTDIMNRQQLLQFKQEILSEVNSMLDYRFSAFRREVLDKVNDRGGNDKQIMVHQAKELVKAVVPEVVKAVETRVMAKVDRKMDSAIRYVDQQTLDGAEAVTAYRKNIDSNAMSRQLFFE